MSPSARTTVGKVSPKLQSIYFLRPKTQSCIISRQTLLHNKKVTWANMVLIVTSNFLNEKWTYLQCYIRFSNIAWLRTFFWICHVYVTDSDVRDKLYYKMKCLSLNKTWLFFLDVKDFEVTERLPYSCLEIASYRR